MSNSESEFPQALWMMLLILTILKTLVLNTSIDAISASIASTSKNSNYDDMIEFRTRLEHKCTSQRYINAGSDNWDLN